MTEAKKTKKSNDEIKESNDVYELLKKMQSEINDLQKQNIFLANQNYEMKNVNVEREQFDEHMDITVVSMTKGALNLSTESLGRGNLYVFKEMWEENEIPYLDLKRISQVYKQSIVGGDCYIKDENIVKKLGLTKAYEKLLSPEEFLELLTYSKNKFKKTYSNMTNNQKEALFNLVVEKLAQGEDIDQNVVMFLSEETEKNINEMAGYRKKLNIK